MDPHLESWRIWTISRLLLARSIPHMSSHGQTNWWIRWIVPHSMTHRGIENERPIGPSVSRILSSCRICQINIASTSLSWRSSFVRFSSDVLTDSNRSQYGSSSKMSREAIASANLQWGSQSFSDANTLSTVLKSIFCFSQVLPIHAVVRVHMDHT